MDFTGVFTYNAQNLVIEPQNGATALMIAGGFFVGIVLLRIIFIYGTGLYLHHKAEKIKQNKKKVLSDLVLMKDIQTELEKEIEQATLKAAFQN